jgi:ABC-type dipeptide/oligopeptide/nickel transport system ATPase component
VVESGDARAVLDNPQHPYSILLKNSVLSPDVPGDDVPGHDEPQTIERDRAVRSY